MIKITLLITISLITSACISIKSNEPTVLKYNHDDNVISKDSYSNKRSIRPVKFAPLVHNFLSARTAENIGDIANANEFYINAMAADPNNIELAERAFMYSLASGHMQVAIPLAKKLAKTETPSPLIFLVLTMDEAVNGTLDNARYWLKAAKASSPRLLQFQVIESYLDIEEGVTIEQVSKKLEEFEPHVALQAYHMYHIARLYERSGNIESALQAYRMAFDMDPSSIFTTQRLGQLYEKLGYFEKALEVYSKFANNNPDTSLVSSYQKRAKEQLLPKIEDEGLKDDLAEITFGFATLMAAQKLSVASQQLMQLTIHLKPDYDFAKFYLGGLAEARQDFTTAQHWYSQISTTSPIWLAAGVRQANTLEQLGKTEESENILINLYKQHRDENVVIRSLAEFNFRQSRYNKAINYYNELLKSADSKSPRTAQLYFARGAAYERLKAFNKASADLERSIHLFPNNSNVLNYLGYMWVEQNKDIDKAISYISKALVLAPNDGAILDSLGWAYFKQADYTKAVKYLELAVETIPTESVINHHLGDAYEKLNRLNEARTQWQRALNLGPETPEEEASLKAKLGIK